MNHLPVFFGVISARLRSTASCRSWPASFSALVSRSIARCWSCLCRSTVPCTKNRFTVCLPCSLLMTLQGNAGRQGYASYLTYLMILRINSGSQGSVRSANSRTLGFKDCRQRCARAREGRLK